MSELATKETTERKRAATLLASIRKNKQAAAEWIRDVWIFREENLYRFEFGTWANFCKTELGFSRQKIDNDIKAVKELERASLVETARPLPFVQVPLEEAKVLKPELESVPNSDTPKTPKQNPKPRAEKAEKIDPLLPRVREAFDQRYILDAIIGEAKLLNEKIQRYKSTEIGNFLRAEQIDSDFQNIINAVRFAKPWADCVACQQKGCKRCQQCGWLPKEIFNQFPDDLKQLSRVRGDDNE